MGKAFLPCLVSITSPSSLANLDMPKSAILHSLLWSTRTFLAARSRWMICASQNQRLNHLQTISRPATQGARVSAHISSDRGISRSHDREFARVITGERESGIDSSLFFFRPEKPGLRTPRARARRNVRLAATQRRMEERNATCVPECARAKTNITSAKRNTDGRRREPIR